MTHNKKIQYPYAKADIFRGQDDPARVAYDQLNEKVDELHQEHGISRTDLIRALERLGKIQDFLRDRDLGGQSGE